MSHIDTGVIGFLNESFFFFFSKDFFLENYYKSWLDNKFSQSQSIQNIYNNHSNKNKKGKILDTRTKNGQNVETCK